ncbi:MAG: class I SAM-dependent methyltransferase [Magnetococcales bacterium]|nr:class I SAM-dependent methyltransferase [Magnetococcales bacterium]
MDIKTQQRWDRAAKYFDLMGGFGPEKRWRPYKEALFAPMSGRILFLAAGTGLDFTHFPAGQKIVAIDISPEMIKRAKKRADSYPGQIELLLMDVHEMEFPDGHFDQIYTSCTFCSVPDPVRGLEALKRVIKPGGALRMFEHTGSRIFPFRQILNLTNPLWSSIGPDVNRNTVANVQQAGFQQVRVNNHFLDVVRSIEAIAP